MARHGALRPLARPWLQLLPLLACLVAAADSDLPVVTMTYPPRARKNEPTIYFNPTERVQFNWTSTFPRISLELYQGPRADGLWVMYPLLTNVSNATSTFNWEARILSPMSRDDPFHLRLFNAEGADCNRCHSNSSFFEIKQNDGSTSDSRSRNKHALKLGLGLGLGLGIPLLILCTCLVTWLCVRRRRGDQKTKEETASQNGELMVDWKAVQPSVSPTEGRQDGHTADAELGGGHLVEMPGVAQPSEAPSNPAGNERVELEGDSRRD